LKTLILANPVSGSFDKNKFKKCIDILNRKLRKIEVVYTEYAGHAEKIAKKENYDIIIPAGGDGLLNEVINGIENRVDKSKGILLYKIPFGTSNVFCREYKIPINPLKAAEKMNIANFNAIPLGIVGERYFSLMAGFGFDALSVKNVDLNLKKRFSKFAYVYSGLKTFLYEKFNSFEFFANGKRYEANHLIVAVSNKYAGNFNLSKNFMKDKLNIFYLKNGNRLNLLLNIVSIALHNGFIGDKIYSDIIKIKGLDECQIDGDFYQLKSKNNFIKYKKSSFYLVNI